MTDRHAENAGVPLNVGPVAADSLREALAVWLPEIESAASTIDRDRALPGKLAAGMAGAGLFRQLVPREYGGEALPYPDYLAMLRQIGRADGSTGWCVNQASVWATLTAMMPEPLARKIWSNPDTTIANGPIRHAEAIETPTGYRLSGRWPFSSGGRHASWFGPMAVVEEQGRRRTRWFMIPADRVELIDTWDVAGLRGTGSFDFQVDELEVAAEDTFTDGHLYVDGPLYRMSMQLKFAAGFATVALANADAAIANTVDFAGKKPQGHRTALRDKPGAQATVAEALAIHRAASAWLEAAVARLWSELESGELSLDARVNVRMAATHGFHEAARAVDAVYKLWGSDAVFNRHAIQRRFQDAHAMTQHIQARLEHYELLGQHALGLEVAKGFL